MMIMINYDLFDPRLKGSSYILVKKKMERRFIKIIMINYDLFDPRLIGSSYILLKKKWNADLLS